mgnify:CR=1 FL=1
MTRKSILTSEKLPDVNSTEWLSLNDFDGEVWGVADGFEDFYAVSNYGRVKSLRRTIMRKTGVPQTIRERILRQTTGTTGYLCVSLIKPNTKRIYKKVHILVAQAFCKNINDERCINHIDENKKNNHFLNLEFCSYSYNLQYNGGALRRGAVRKLHHPAKKVVMYNLHGTIEEYFNSCEEAATHVGCQASRVNECCNGKRKTAKSHIFRWL